MVVKLNRTYSRAEILRMYAEVAYYGHGYYGLAAASCGCFGQSAGSADAGAGGHARRGGERAQLRRSAGVPAEARIRLVHVIGRMAAVGYLTQAQETAALNAPLGLSAVRGCA